MYFVLIDHPAISTPTSQQTPSMGDILSSPFLLIFYYWLAVTSGHLLLQYGLKSVSLIFYKSYSISKERFQFRSVMAWFSTRENRRPLARTRIYPPNYVLRALYQENQIFTILNHKLNIQEVIWPFHKLPYIPTNLPSPH
jgi:hypothetical protein